MAVARDVGTVTVYYEVAGYLRTYKEVGLLAGVAALLGSSLTCSSASCTPSGPWCPGGGRLGVADLQDITCL